MDALPEEFVLFSHKSYKMGTMLYTLQVRKLRLRNAK